MHLENYWQCKMSELLQLVSREEVKWEEFRCKWSVFQVFLLQSVLFCPVPKQKKTVCPYAFTLKLWSDIARLARWVDVFALRRMLFITASHIHGSTGFDLPITFSAPFLLKLMLFSYFLWAVVLLWQYLPSCDFDNAQLLWKSNHNLLLSSNG